MRKVVDVIRREKMYVNMSKCDLSKTSLEYSSHVIVGGQLKVDPVKVEVIVNWPIPKIVIEVRSFFGATQFWRKFIADFSSIATSLHSLTSIKESF